MTEKQEKIKKTMDRRFCVAPMMEWTDRHCRFFHRLLTRRALIYTEMITTGAVLHGDRARLLGFDPAEHPVALQLGGCDPARARAMRADRRGFRLRRDQSQCRLPVRPRAGGPLRRLPDGGAGAGRRLRRRHEGGGRDSGHGEMPHRHRRAGSRSRRSRRSPRAVEAAGVDALIVHARKAWLDGPVAAREPRHPAARLRPRVPAQGRASGSADRAQRRHRQRRGRRASISRMSTA